MSYLFNSGTDIIRGSFNSTYAKPITIAAFVKVTSHPLAISGFAAIGNQDSDNSDSFLIGTRATVDQWRAHAQAADDTTNTVSYTINIDGVWAGIIGKLTTNSSRDIYVQALANTAHASALKAISDTLKYVAIGDNLQGTQEFPGLVAEVAMWNMTLADGDITDYMNGVAASGIQAANLIGYWSLNSDTGATVPNAGIDAGGTLTVTNATFDSDHPTITSGAVARKRRTALMGIG